MGCSIGNFRACQMPPRYGRLFAFCRKVAGWPAEGGTDRLPARVRRRATVAADAFGIASCERGGSWTHKRRNDKVLSLCSFNFFLRKFISQLVKSVTFLILYCHCATDARSVRVQDLIDLQLIMSHETVDLREVHRICERVFANRKSQSWPPTLKVTDEWRIAYDKTKGELDVLSSCDEACSWLTDLIGKISQA